MTIAAPHTRTDIMARAWDLPREHMQFNRFTRSIFARNLKIAWREAKALLAGFVLPHQLSNTERNLIALQNKNHPTATDEALIAELVALDHAEKRDLIASAKGRFCAVTFTKKDGTERTMKVQPAALKFHVKGEAASLSAQKAVATRSANHPNLLNVWDIEAKAPRSINLATVSTITLDGLSHAYQPA